jgi:hypothetical protein
MATNPTSTCRLEGVDHLTGRGERDKLDRHPEAPRQLACEVDRDAARVPGGGVFVARIGLPKLIAARTLPPGANSLTAALGSRWAPTGVSKTTSEGQARFSASVPRPLPGGIGPWEPGQESVPPFGDRSNAASCRHRIRSRVVIKDGCDGRVPRVGA